MVTQGLLTYTEGNLTPGAYSGAWQAASTLLPEAVCYPADLADRVVERPAGRQVSALQPKVIDHAATLVKARALREDAPSVQA